MCWCHIVKIFELRKTRDVLTSNDRISDAINADVAKQLKLLSSNRDWLRLSSVSTEYFTKVAAIIVCWTRHFTEVETFIVRSNWMFHRN